MSLRGPAGPPRHPDSQDDSPAFASSLQEMSLKYLLKLTRTLQEPETHRHRSASRADDVMAHVQKRCAAQNDRLLVPAGPERRLRSGWSCHPPGGPLSRDPLVTRERAQPAATQRERPPGHLSLVRQLSFKIYIAPFSSRRTISRVRKNAEPLRLASPGSMPTARF